MSRPSSLSGSSDPAARATRVASTALVSLACVWPCIAMARDAGSRDPVGRERNVRGVASRLDEPAVDGASRDPRGSRVERPYAPAPLLPLAPAGRPQDGANDAAAAHDGRMSAEERRRLRREIHEAGRDVYRGRR